MPQIHASSPLRTWGIALGLSLGAIVAAGYARFAYGLILPAMRADLHWTYTQAGWINTANALGYFAGSLATLATIGRWGARPLFVIGVWGATLSLAMTGVSGELWSLSLWRFMSGVGGAPIYIAGGALAAGLFPDSPKRNATSIAMFFGAGGFGILLSALLLPAMFDRLGVGAWRQAWLALAGLSALSALVSMAAVAATRPPAASPSAIVSEPPPVARLFASLVGYGLFALGYIIYLTFLVAWMRARAVPTSGVVMTWSLLGVGAMLGPFLWRGVLAAHASGRPLALGSLASGLAAAIPLVWTDGWGFQVSAFLFGLCFFNAPTAVTSFTRKNLEPRYWGRTVALYTTIFAIGQTLGPVGAGWLIDATGNLAHGFAASAAILILGAAAAAGQKALAR